MVLVEEHPDTDVKLALEYEERTLDILLDDEGVVLDFVC